ncbi:metalloprotease TldD [Cernens ardua]|uniref:metalloprotease TldD n=1 Tax=Cernens ardua TaxID=3402176 RepID=UPI003F9E63D0
MALFSNASDVLKTAESMLLTPTGLDLSSLDSSVTAAIGPGIDFAEVFLQRRWEESWVLAEGRVTSGQFNSDGGLGIRSIAEQKTGFAYSNQITDEALATTAATATSIVKCGQQIERQPVRVSDHSCLYVSANPFSARQGESAAQAAAKIALLHRIDKLARAADTSVTHVNAELFTQYEVVLVQASDGTLAADLRPLIRLNVSVIAERNGRRETARAGGGGRFDFDVFVHSSTPGFLVQEAVRKALVNLDSVASPAGEFPVILAAGWPGVLLHEAVGHGLEGDFNRKGSSAFAGRLGEQVASPGVTVVDDGTLKHRRGSLSVDDEGTPTESTTLIEDGRLTGYMQDKLNARLMGMQPTGNGRRQSYAHLPMPRMTNTYMQPGAHDPEEMIASVDRGIYAVGFSGGQVDITTGEFVFSANEAYLIERGKLTAPLKGAMLVGNGPAVMSRISMIGHDLQLDGGTGNCGKEAQMVPVGVGQPTLKLDRMTVGGTQA